MRGALVGGEPGLVAGGGEAGRRPVERRRHITEIRLRVASAVVLFHACPFLHVGIIALAPRAAIASWQPLVAYTPVATEGDGSRSHLTPLRNRNGSQHFLAPASPPLRICWGRLWSRSIGAPMPRPSRWPRIKVCTSPAITPAPVAARFSDSYCPLSPPPPTPRK